jgi:dolichol-phosphate mannosyltransferase
MPDLSILIPTLNEEGNISNTIRRIETILSIHKISSEFLILDGNSTDNTLAEVNSVQSDYPNIIWCPCGKSLSGSVIEGFQIAKGDAFLLTDADSSHDLDLIPEMYHALSSADVIVGSRYMKNGGIDKWPISRKAISFGATFLARLLFPNVQDPVSGFFCVKKSVVENVELNPIGYKILLEILGRGNYTKVTELPYTFQDRKVGQSKLKSKTILDYIKQIIELVYYTLTHPTSPARKELTYLIKFSLVGLSGILINSMMLYLLVNLNLSYLVASPIAIELAILWNFAWNDRWTFKAAQKGELGRLMRFHGVSFGGAVINYVVLVGLTSIGLMYLLANLIGILLGFAWNFVVNRRHTWKQ